MKNLFFIIIIIILFFSCISKNEVKEEEKIILGQIIFSSPFTILYENDFFYWFKYVDINGKTIDEKVSRDKTWIIYEVNCTLYKKVYKNGKFCYNIVYIPNDSYVMWRKDI